MPRSSSSAVSLGIKLTKAGEELLHHPSSSKGIIKSLVQTENLLSRIPLLSISIVQPLHVIREALIAEDLVRHSNMVVKMSVACCMCEIMRIMAPNTPYDDNQMKEFFELVLTVFENVSSSSGECYTKMIKVIETLSSGELAVLMCHLKLNEQIVRLFKWFLTAAGLSSSYAVSKMEKIMTMIVKESKELPRELVNLLVVNGKSSNQVASPVRVQLAKKVLKKYADQLNPDIPDTTEGEQKTLAIIETPVPSKSVSKVNGKRKKQIQSDEHGEDLVGSRIKVWWPEDNTYYEGTVKSFQSHNKKHKVWYDDGDNELIDLKMEKWELVEDVSPMLDCSQSVEHGKNLVGSRIKVWWPEDNTYYEGTVKSYQSHNKKHKVRYDDGDAELIDLKTEKWELLEDLSLMLDCAQSAEHGENLVGSRIKVWWPADKSYYEGVVESFDQSNKKHKVLYDDGDEDVLNLNQRQWTLIEDVSAIEPVPDELAVPLKILFPQALAIKSSSTQAPHEKVSSTQAPPTKVSTTQSGLKSVQGYKVKKSIAPILEDIIKKHGDIASDCVFKTPSVRASMLEVICEVFSRIQTNDVADTISEMEEIQCQVSAAEANKINVSWLQQHLDAIQKRNVKKEKCSWLMKEKAIISLVIKAAKKDLEETRIEFLTAQEQFRKAERCVEVLKLVEKKLNDNFLEESKSAIALICHHYCEMA